MKKGKLLSVVGLVVCLMSLFSLQVFAIDAPFFQDDIEQATGGKADGLEGTAFAWPFPGGENSLMLADKSDAATSKYVIEGNKSMYFNNTGDTAAPDMSPLITKAGPDNVLVFDPAKTYIIRYLMKVVTPFSQDAKLTLTVRTWDWNDPWVNIIFTPGADGTLTAAVDSKNARIYDKVAIQSVGKDTYEVAVRFQGVTNKTSCYLFWYLEKQAALSFDGFKFYESKDDPSKAFVLTAGASDAAPDTTADSNPKTDEPAADAVDANTDTAADNNPKTGDNLNTFVTLLALSGVLLAFAIVLRKSKKVTE